MGERAMTPGPGAYNLPDSLDLITGGAFNKSNPKTDIEWIMHRAKQTPGPGRYLNKEQMSGLTKSGGAWSKYKPKSHLDFVILHANDSPAPGHPQPPMIPGKERNLKQLSKSFGISNKAAMFAARLKRKLSGKRAAKSAGKARDPSKTL